MEPVVSIEEQKIAEKLTILNTRCIGMLTQLYNVKKACGDPKSRPKYFFEKAYEPLVIKIHKKFPHIDTSKDKAIPQMMKDCYSDIFSILHYYYQTFVDILDFVDSTREVLTSISVCGVFLNITVNFDLTNNYLKLVTNYFKLMILLGRVDDRKLIVGLFNIAHEMQNGSTEQSYHRLSQAIHDLESPLKKLTEEFSIHSKTLRNALSSLDEVYHDRYAIKETVNGLISIVSRPMHIKDMAKTPKMRCDLVSRNTINEWILIGYLLCNLQFPENESHRLWKEALQDCFCFPLYRDEVIVVQRMYETPYMQSNKQLSKRLKEVADYINYAVMQSGTKHKEIRNILMMTLHELRLMFTDQPGLLGPKAHAALTLLSLTRNEIQWLVHHSENIPLKFKNKVNVSDYQEENLSEMLFCLHEIRVLFRKHADIVLDYYVRCMSEVDVFRVSDACKKTPVVQEDYQHLVTSFTNSMKDLAITEAEDKAYNLVGFRLDWFRFQAYASVAKPIVSIHSVPELISAMDLAVAHSFYVDALEEHLNDIADLSFLFFFTNFFQFHFGNCIEDYHGARYAIAFPVVCDDFIRCTNEFCPEEKSPIRHRSITSAEKCLEDMAKQAAYHIEELCREYIKFEQQLMPINATNTLKQESAKKKKKQKDKGKSREFIVPGTESYRRSREQVTRVDKIVFAVNELLAAFTQYDVIRIGNATLCPVEYLREVIEETFSGSFAALTFYDPATSSIGRPSETLRNIFAFVGTLKSIDNFANMDIGGLLFNSMLQHTQEVDSKKQKTVTSLYASWFTDVLLHKITHSRGIVYTPNHKMFRSHKSVPLKAECYTDIVELESLVEIIGPYGMRTICNKIVEKICAEILEVKKIVQANSSGLEYIRNKKEFKDANKTIKDCEELVNKTIRIGVMLCFRQLFHAATYSVLSRRTPTLLGVVEEFLRHPPDDSYILHKYETASVTGIRYTIDSVLYSALKPKKDNANEENRLWLLYMVMIAISLPNLLAHDDFVYENVLDGFRNNAHCIAQAVSQLASVFFSAGGEAVVEERLIEFLSIVSQCMLNLETKKSENENEIPKHYESLYILLDMIVQESPFLKSDILETYIPHTIISDAYRLANFRDKDVKKRRKKADARSHDYA